MHRGPVRLVEFEKRSDLIGTFIAQAEPTQRGRNTDRWIRGVPSKGWPWHLPSFGVEASSASTAPKSSDVGPSGRSRSQNRRHALFQAAIGCRVGMTSTTASRALAVNADTNGSMSATLYAT